MTSPDQIATRLRHVAASARELTIELQHRSWYGGPSHDEEIANLTRAVEHLDDAAEALVGEALPAKPAIVRAAASTGVWAAVTAAVLATVPRPGRPGVVLVAVLAGWVVADIVLRAIIAVRWRRAAAMPAAPLDQEVPERIGRMRASVDEILERMAPADHRRMADAIESVRGARIWLA